MALVDRSIPRSLSALSQRQGTFVTLIGQDECGLPRASHLGVRTDLPLDFSHFKVIFSLLQIICSWKVYSNRVLPARFTSHYTYFIL